MIRAPSATEHPAAHNGCLPSGNEFVGFQANGSVVVRDRRGTVKAEIPSSDEKGFAGGSDPLAIYKPTGAKQVDAAKPMLALRLTDQDGNLTTA